MSAEILRKAASLMRERAEAVTTRLTKCERPDECSAGGFCGSPQLADMWPENAEHIASWHPAVALAVADWLDVSAEVADIEEREGWGHGSLTRHAIPVARAYLGEST